MKSAANRKYHYLYKITRDDGKYYIGMHSSDIIDDGYRGSGKWIKCSIAKHGFDPRHIWEIIQFSSSREALIEAEREMVTESLLRDSLCMNLCVGGRWGILSEESRRKISESNVRRLGIKHSPERNAKISASRRGMKFSEEHKAASGKAKQKSCTVDGIIIYPSRGALVAALGTGKHGERSPSFRFIGES